MVTAGVGAGGTRTTAASAADTGMAEVQRLMTSGQLRIEQLMGADLHEGQVLSWLKVELAPGVVEPAHVHPGFEGIFVVTGRGFVQLDRATRVSLEPGEFVRVERGTVKSLGNDGADPLVAVAVLILDRDAPPLTVAQ